MPAEVQITELAVNRAKIERECAQMAVRGTGLRLNGELLTKPVQQESAGNKAGLVHLLPPPGQKVCSWAPMWRDTCGRKE